MSPKPRILYVVYEQGNFQLGRMLAEMGRDAGAFDTVLWSPYALPDGPRFREEALEARSVYVEEYALDGGLADIHSHLSSWLTARPERLPVSGRREILRWPVWKSELPAKRLLNELDQVEQLEALRAADRNLRRISFCEDWLVRLGIDAIVFAEDNVERDSFAWIAAARRRGIRTVVSTYGMLSLHEAENAYKRSSSHALSEPHLSLFRRYLSKWLAEGADYAITRLPWAEALGRELVGEVPFNPWLVNTGRADVIALESEVMEEGYLAQGFDRAHLAVLGHPLHDSLAAVRSQRAERRTALAKRQRFDSDKPLIIVAVPPNQLSSRPAEFADYPDLAAAFHRAPAEIANANVVVSPHPSTSAAEVSAMEAAGARVERVSVAELLPLADLYLASASSTIKWALALGVPVIDFDCYGYGYPDYLGLEQVWPVSTGAELKKALIRWQDRATQARFQAAAQRDASRWGKIDGRALERLVVSCFA